MNLSAAPPHAQSASRASPTRVLGGKCAPQGSGIELCSGARLLHLPLFCSWADADANPELSEVAFRGSAFSDWRCTSNDHHCRVGGLWSNDTLAATRRSCDGAAFDNNWFRLTICTAIGRYTDLHLPLGPLAALLRAA